MDVQEPEQEWEETLPSQTAFSQQRINAWRPLFTPLIILIFLLVLGILFVVAGALIKVSSDKLFYLETRYDDKCEDSTICRINITIDRDIESTVYLHYKLTNFYQNHKRYVNSRSYEQLQGNYVEWDDLVLCDPYRSTSGENNFSEYIYPCGAAAYSFFNDSYAIYDEGGEELSFVDAGIPWRSDIDKLFGKMSKTYEDNGVTTWMDPEIVPGMFKNEHFVVWMRSAALPTFNKLYARCVSCEIPRGTYTLEIVNRYPSSVFSGHKSIILSTATAIGGKNEPMAIAYMVFGCFFIIAGVGIYTAYKLAPRTLGDPSFLYALDTQTTPN